jgi:hypothetical protein
VTGAAGKVSRLSPSDFDDARTASWAKECHFLLAKIDGDRMTVSAIGPMDEFDGTPTEIERFDPAGAPVRGPIEIQVGSD